MKISRQRTVKQSPEAIWEAISPVESIPKWLSGAEKAEHLSGGKEGKGRRQRVTLAMHTHTLETDQEVVAWEPAKRLETLNLRETMGGKELTGVRRFRTAIILSPAGKGTRVRAEYSWDARFGLPWLLSILFAGRVMGRELRETLTRINDLVGE